MGRVWVCLIDCGEKVGSSSWKVEERDSAGACRLMRRRPETPSTLSFSTRWALTDVSVLFAGSIGNSCTASASVSLVRCLRQTKSVIVCLRSLTTWATGCQCSCSSGSGLHYLEMQRHRAGLLRVPGVRLLKEVVSFAHTHASPNLVPNAMVPAPETSRQRRRCVSMRIDS